MIVATMIVLHLPSSDFSRVTRGPPLSPRQAPASFLSPAHSLLSAMSTTDNITLCCYTVMFLIPSLNPANFSLQSLLLKTVSIACKSSFDLDPLQLVLPHPATCACSDTNSSLISLGVCDGRQTGWIPGLKDTSLSSSTIAISLVNVDLLNCLCFVVLRILNSSGLAPSVWLPIVCSYNIGE